jgi:hypothetical protein
MDARLDSAFESWGKFSATMTDGPSIPGRLSYDPRKGIELELVMAPTAVGLSALMAEPSLPTLYGQLLNGTLVTLVGCITTKTQTWLGSAESLTTLTANRMLVGAQVDDLDQLRVKSYTTELSSLANWTCASRPMPEPRIRDGKCVGVDVSFRRPDPIDIALSDRKFDLSISHGWTTSSDSGCSIRWHAGVTIAARDSMVFADISKVAWQCENLMSLLIGHQLSRRSIALRPVDLVASGSAGSPLHLIYQQCGKHDHPDLRPSQMLLPYSLVKEDFPQIVAKWFARSEQAALATNIFFGSKLLESPTVEDRFLAATQAAESYHRSLGTGKYMKQEEYDAAISQFVCHMPAAIQAEHRQSLEKRLKYGNEYSLLKRLKEMLNRIPSDARERISCNVSKFAAKVKDTRNYFTHWDHESKQKALEEDVVVAAERLGILIVANLLHDLGIKDEMLLSVLQRSVEFRHWMSAELRL